MITYAVCDLPILCNLHQFALIDCFKFCIDSVVAFGILWIGHPWSPEVLSFRREFEGFWRLTLETPSFQDK